MPVSVAIDVANVAGDLQNWVGSCFIPSRPEFAHGNQDLAAFTPSSMMRTVCSVAADAARRAALPAERRTTRNPHAVPPRPGRIPRNALERPFHPPRNSASSTSFVC